MAKCRTCNIEILDETAVCPLCQTILEPTDEVENMYPNVRVRMRRLKIFSRIYLFLAICAEVVLLGINLVTESRIWWSAITGLMFFYFYLLLRYAILGSSGYRSKVIVLTAIFILSAVTADFVIGYRGWSVDYVLPVGILVVDAFVLGCMYYNRRNWQSYIMCQLLTILCSLIPTLLYWLELEHNPAIAFLPLTVSVLTFLGTVIIGDRRARMELLRRFHI